MLAFRGFRRPAYFALNKSISRSTLNAISRPTLNTLRPFFAAIRPLGTIPQPPGFIVGTVNDAVPVPPMQKTKGSYHWSFERAITVGLVPLAVGSLFTGSLTPVLDATFGSLVILHAQTGLESCIIDYIPRRTFGGLHTLAIAALYTGSIVALIGLYEYETKDVGLTETVRKVWNA